MTCLAQFLCPALASPDSRGAPSSQSSERGEKREGGSMCPLLAFSPLPPIVPIVSHEFSSSPLLLLLFNLN